jgi:hypothetical protein
VVLFTLTKLGNISASFSFAFGSQNDAPSFFKISFPVVLKQHQPLSQLPWYWLLKIVIKHRNKALCNNIINLLLIVLLLESPLEWRGDQLLLSLKPWSIFNFLS